MNIGIVTQVLSDNFGGILQNYALQTVLRRLGHNPITFYVFPHRGLSMRTWIFHTAKYLLCKMLHRSEVRYCGFYYRRDRQMEHFVNHYINVTPVCRRYQDINITDLCLDVVMVGSDQVWRKSYNRTVWRDKFLEFLGDRDVKRIAYAASWGSDKCEFAEAELVVAQKLVQKFDAISVREKTGINLCRNFLNVDAIEVLDPTLLLTKEEYSKLILNVPVPEEPYLAAYVLDQSLQKKEIIQYVAAKKKLKVVDFSLGKNNLSVEEWLALFAHAEFVLTDSFHGTVFSIINERPFATIVNKRRGAARFESLLEKFGLEGRVADNINQIDSLSEIDWAVVVKHIKEWKAASLDFLNKNL